MGVPGPGGPCSEIYYDTRPRVRPRRRPRGGRGPVTWRSGTWSSCRTAVSAVRAKDDFDVEGPLPFKNVDTGMGLERMAVAAAGRGQHLRDRHHVQDPGQGGRAHRAGLRHRPAQRRRAARRRRPRAQRGDADRGRRAAGQRGRRLRAAAAAAPLASATCGCWRARQRGGGASDGHRLHARADRGHDRRDGRAVPRAAPRTPRTSTRSSTRRRRRSRARCAPAPRSSTSRSRRPSASTPSVLSGAQAFQLHDTYGFPIDLTLEMAAEQGLSVDEDGLPPAHGRAARSGPRRTRAEKKTGNADISVYASLLEQAGKVTFTGYDAGRRARRPSSGCSSGGVPVQVRGRRARRSRWCWTGPRSTPRAAASSPDHGVIRTDGPAATAEIEVTDVQTPLPGLIVHRGTVRYGEVTTGSPAYAEIDVERRRATSRSHTATHLVHRALRGALGESAAQAGSENAPGRLRFDFTATGRGAGDGAARGGGRGQPGPHRRPDGARVPHLDRRGALDGRARAVRREVRQRGPRRRGRRVLPRAVRRHPRGPVRASSAWSSCSARRRSAPACAAIEALVGIDAFRFLARESVLVSQLSEQLKARPEELPERISGVVTQAPRRGARAGQAHVGAAARESAGEIAAARGEHRRRRVRRAPGAGRHRRRRASAGSRWTCGARSRRRGPAVVALIGAPGGPAGRGHRGQRGGPRGAACRRARWSAARRGRSAAAAAASRTSRRAAARRAPGTPRPLR